MSENNLRALRTKLGLTMRDVADRLDDGTHHTTIGKLENGQRGLTGDWVRKLAAAMGVDPSEIIGGPPERGAPRQVRMVPRIGSIAAGNWRLAIEDPQGYVPATVGGPKTFALDPIGDSMNRAFPDGAYVLVDPDQPTLIDGKIYAVKNGAGEATVKRFRLDPPRLEPDSTNPEHKPMLLGIEPFQVIGRVIMSAVEH